MSRFEVQVWCNAVGIWQWTSLCNFANVIVFDLWMALIYLFYLGYQSDFSLHLDVETAFFFNKIWCITVTEVSSKKKTVTEVQFRRGENHYKSKLMFSIFLKKTVSWLRFIVRPAKAAGSFLIIFYFDWFCLRQCPSIIYFRTWSIFSNSVFRYRAPAQSNMR